MAKTNKLAKDLGLSPEIYKNHPDRVTGKTTANTLEAIAFILRNPNQKIRIKDIMPEEYGCMETFHYRRSYERLESTIRQLGLRRIYMKKFDMTVYYDLYEEELSVSDILRELALKLEQK